MRPTAPLPQRPPVAPVPLLEAQVKELQVQIRQLMAQVLGLEARMKDLGPRTDGAGAGSGAQEGYEAVKSAVGSCRSNRPMRPTGHPAPLSETG